MSDDGRDRLNRALRWLVDPTLYSSLFQRLEQQTAPRASRPSTLSKADTSMLLQIQRFEATDQVKCGANVFTVLEWAKQRRRLIIEPLLNDVITASDFDQIRLPTSACIRQMANLPFFVQFDAKAFYDQLPLAKGVRQFFGVGDNIVSSCLPMGFRPACCVAQRVAETLLDFESHGVMKTAYIDNFFIAGHSKSDVIRAVQIFLARCEVAGVVLNETEPVFADSFDALGEHFDTSTETRHLHNGNGLVSLTAPTIQKLQAAKEQLCRQDTGLLSFRQVAAIYGIAFFAARVLGRPPSFAFLALRFYREQIATTQTWSATAPRISGVARQELEGWIDALLLNIPVELGEALENVPQCVVYSDASAWGWGCCVVRDGQTKNVSAPWTVTESLTWNTQSSVAAEPLAVLHAAAAAVRRGDKHLVIFTDHLPLVFAWRRGYGKAWAYNEMVVRLKQALPGMRVDIEFIPGATNPADRWSRGFTCGELEGEIGMNECSMG